MERLSLCGGENEDVLVEKLNPASNRLLHSSGLLVECDDIGSMPFAVSQEAGVSVSAASDVVWVGHVFDTDAAENAEVGHARVAAVKQLEGCCRY